MRIATAMVVLGLVALIGPATDADAAAEEHCVVEVIGQQPSGEFVTTPMVCRSSQEEAMAASGGGESLLSTSAIHYDGLNLTGSSYTVSNVSCSGGWINLPLSWRNRISSTDNGCYRVRHFDSINLFGSSQDTVGAWGNLSTLDNKAESIQYFSS